jgi:hypothetical protein
MELQRIPDWANNLANYYVCIGVEGRNKTLRRRYYRFVELEKLRLAMLGIDQQQIKAVCRYLSGLSKIKNQKAAIAMYTQNPQMSLDLRVS